MGLYLIGESINVALTFFSSLPYFMDEEATLLSIGISFLITLAVLGFYAFVVQICLFQTDWVIDKLQLTKGLSEEPFTLKINQTNLLSIVVYLIAGFILLDSIPHFCKQVFEYFQQRYVHESFLRNPSTKYIVFHALKIGIAYLIIDKHRQIITFIQ